MTCRPNRATGTRAAISIQEETCWGTLAEESDPVVEMEALGFDFSSETLRNEINNVESGLIRADRMRSAGQQGNKRPGGDVTGEFQPHGAWPLVLKHILGGNVETVGSGPYTHSLRGSVELPEGLTIEKKFGYPDGSAKYIRHLGARANEFELTVPNEGIVTARAGFISRQELNAGAVSMDAAPTYPADNEPFNSFQGAILLDRAGDGTREAIATIRNLRMLINNSMSGDEFAIDGSNGLRADIPDDQRLISGSLVAFFTDDNYQMYQSYLDNTTVSLELTLVRGLYSAHFTLPALKLRGNATPQVSGRGPLDMNFDFEAHRDDALQTDILVTITNADPVISTAA